MEAIRGFVLLFVAVTVIDAARVPSNIYKQTKVPVGRNPSGKHFVQLPGEWINVSIKSDPVITVPSGRALELECEAVGSPPPTIKWHHGNNLITEGGFVELNEVVNTAIGKIRSRLVIDCVMPHHQGIYSCTGVSGVKTKDSLPVSVIVEESETGVQCQRNSLKSPRIVAWGPTILEVIDRDVSLPCVAVGNPQPAIYWLNNRNQIIDTDVISPHYKVLDNGDLLISQITWDDMGTYTCVAQNSAGQDKTESFIYPVKKEGSNNSE